MNSIQVENQKKPIIDFAGEAAIDNTTEKKRPWHLELAISLTIAGLGTMVWLASTSTI